MNIFFNKLAANYPMDAKEGNLFWTVLHFGQGWSACLSPAFTCVSDGGAEEGWRVATARPGRKKYF